MTSSIGSRGSFLRAFRASLLALEIFMVVKSDGMESPFYVHAAVLEAAAGGKERGHSGGLGIGLVGYVDVHWYHLI